MWESEVGWWHAGKLATFWIHLWVDGTDGVPKASSNDNGVSAVSPLIWNAGNLVSTSARWFLLDILFLGWSDYKALFHTQFPFAPCKLFSYHLCKVKRSRMKNFSTSIFLSQQLSIKGIIRPNRNIFGTKFLLPPWSPFIFSQHWCKLSLKNSKHPGTSGTRRSIWIRRLFEKCFFVLWKCFSEMNFSVVTWTGSPNHFLKCSIPIKPLFRWKHKMFSIFYSECFSVRNWRLLWWSLRNCRKSEVAFSHNGCFFITERVLCTPNLKLNATLTSINHLCRLRRP